MILALSTVLASWLLMQAIHEFGHVCGAWVTGGTIRHVVLVPWELSRTDLLENSQPLIVCWLGPILGTALPLAVWLIVYGLGGKSAYWFRFLAGFCLIANGTYIGIGAWTRDGDAGDLLRHGASAWTLVSFGLATSVAGLCVWHGLGPSFGFGASAPVVRWRPAFICLTSLALIVLLECVFAC